MDTKVCPTCKVEKSTSEFFKAKNKSDGLQSCCKICHKARMQSYQERMKATERKVPESKHCSGCGETKPASEFAFAANQATKLSPWCRSCMRDHRKKAKRDNPIRFLLMAARSRAKSSGLPFNLTMDDIVIPMFCPVLGIKLEISDGYQRDASPSLDKIVPERGYVKGNIVITSWRANRLKGDATVDELRKVADFYSKL